LEEEEEGEEEEKVVQSMRNFRPLTLSHEWKQ